MLLLRRKKGVAIQVGIRAIKWIVEQLFGMVLNIDLTVSDHNLAVRAAMRITDPAASSALDYPPHFRAPRELWVHRIRAEDRKK